MTENIAVIAVALATLSALVTIAAILCQGVAERKAREVLREEAKGRFRAERIPNSVRREETRHPSRGEPVGRHSATDQNDLLNPLNPIGLLNPISPLNPLNQVWQAEPTREEHRSTCQSSYDLSGSSGGSSSDSSSSCSPSSSD